MISARRMRPWLVALLSLACFVLFAWVLALYRDDPDRGLPYTASLAPEKMGEWTAFGGTWSASHGVMRNDSDERGAKILTGSSYWQSYSVEADLKLVGIQGNAGLIIRASDAELGIDSYRGYYAGIRNDGALTLGLADHGWSPIAIQPLLGGVQRFEWYHLRLIAFGCEIIASATPLAGSSLPASIAVYDPYCVKSGKIGLRSFSSGGIWRNIHVRSVTYKDIAEILPQIAVERLPPLGGTAIPPFTDYYYNLSLSSFPSGEAPVQITPPVSAIQKIADLRLVSPIYPGLATVQGTVILTKPELFIQDSTGGVSIPHPNAPTLKIGDEVEATGTPEPHDFSSVLKNATIRLLWEREPLLPLAVTAAQAATGAFGAMFIQIDGHLQAKQMGAHGVSALYISDKDQGFRVLIADPAGRELFRKLSPHSLLRFRGICVVDPAYTHNLTPFVLLLPATGGIDILAGPPWWSSRYLPGILASLLLLSIAGYLLYNQIARWRLHSVIEERERVAHEMHDTLAQSFAGIGFQLQAIRHAIHDQNATLRRQLDLACDLVRHSHQEARQNISILRPQILETGGLLAALGSSAETMVEGGSVQIIVTGSGDSGVLPVRISESFFRIAQEAIANAVRHSGASSIELSLHRSKGMIQLAVEDNGDGFNPERHHGGFGLEGMRKRADMASAILHIESRLGYGTRVQVTAHLPPMLNLITFPKYAWRYFAELQRSGSTDERENTRSYRR